MAQNNITTWRNKPFLASIALYLLLAIVLLPYYRFQINPDGVSYISIAQKYASGDLENALNGYWSPMLSWLLTPFIFWGTPPILAPKLLSILIGFFTLFRFQKLVYRLQFTPILAYSSLLTSAIIIIYFALNVITPDLLFVGISLWYLHQVSNSKSNPIKIGIIGALLYFTRSFGLPFFLAHFSVTTIIFALKGHAKKPIKTVLKNYALTMVTFLALISFWVAPISKKYDHFTIGNSGHYNFTLISPESKGHLVHYVGFIPPPNQTAINAWEDISYVKTSRWEIFSSSQSIFFYAKIIIDNIFLAIHFLFHSSILAIPILLLSLHFIYKKREHPKFAVISLLLITIGILSMGYAMVYIEYRYIWLNTLIITLLGFLLLKEYFNTTPIHQTNQYILIIALSLSLIIPPILNIISDSNTGKTTYLLSQKLHHLPIQGNIASNNLWAKTLYLSFYNNWRYFGETGLTKPANIENQLTKHKIKFFFLWKDGDSKNYLFLQKYPEISNNQFNDLKIYRMR